MIPLPVEDEWLARGAAPTAPPASTQPVCTLLTVARLERAARDKGIADVIRSLPTLRAAVPLRYVVVGDGDDLPYLRQLARDLGVDDMVAFLGNVSDAELFRAYEDADVFVLLSRREGFGLVFTEAMAFGLPVVALAARASGEVVTDQVDGYLVRSVDEMPAAIVALATSPALRSRMGRAGQEAAATRFSMSAFTLQVHHVIEAAARHSSADASS